jgi:uncharacterized membrane protein
MGQLGYAFSNSLMQLVKIFIYTDTAISFTFQKYYAMSGYYGMYSIVTALSFIANRVFNDGV